MSSRYNKAWYLNTGDSATHGYYAIQKRKPSWAYAIGEMVLPSSPPAVGSAGERIYLCYQAGITSANADASWNVSFWSTTIDGTVKWIERGGGVPALNGDAGNTMSWAEAKAFDPVPLVGAIIKNNNSLAFQLCTQSGTMGALEPNWTNTTGGINVAGTVVGDGSVLWTSLGPVTNFPKGGAPYGQIANLLGLYTTQEPITTEQTIFIAHDNVENVINGTIGINGVDCTFMKLISHNRLGNYPPGPSDLLPGARFVSTQVIHWGSYYSYGINYINQGPTLGFKVGIDGTSLRGWLYFEKCTFQNVNTACGQGVRIGSAQAGDNVNTIIFDDCMMAPANVNQSLIMGAVNFTWKNNSGSIYMPGSVIPNSLFFAGDQQGMPGMSNFENMDLSEHNTAIYSASQPFYYHQGPIMLKDCRINPLMIDYPQGTWGFGGGGTTIQLSRCDPSAYWYKSKRFNNEGTEVTETAITRIGGSADRTGARTSRKVTTTASAAWFRPFRMEPYGTWNIRLGAPIIVMIHGVANWDAPPNNDDIWIEVTYSNTASSPQGAIATTTKLNILSVGTPCEIDTLASWDNANTAPMYWEPSTLTGVTLSNGNLTAQNSGSTAADQGTKCGLSLGRLTGKYYHEVTLNVFAGGGNNGVGVGSVATNYTNMGNSATGGANCYWNTGTIYSNGSNPGVSIGARVANDVIGIATDLDNRKIWFRKVNGVPGNWNNSGTADPATNVGGVNLPAGLAMVPFATFGGSGGLAGNRVTLNCGQNLFTLLSRPAGFGNWSSYWTPFKMRATITPGVPGYIHVRVRVGKPNTTYYIDPKIEISV